MKSILVIAVFIAVAAASHVWVAGTTNQTGVATPLTAPSVSGVTTCTVDTAPSGYQMFTINTTVAAFYYITGLADPSFYSYMQIQVYNGAGTTAGFNPATPCANIRRVATYYSSTAPHFAILEYFAVGVYDVVITSELGSSAYSGLFAVHADPSQYTGANFGATQYWWSTVDASYYGTSTCSVDSNSVPYVAHNFTVPSTGAYDLFYWSYNGTTSISYIYAALYNNTPTFITTPSTNSSNPSDPCVNDAGKFVSAVYNYGSESYSQISQSSTGYEVAAMWRYTLTAGVTYTVVISGYYSYDTGNFGFYWRPSTGRDMSLTGDFVYPDFSGPCTPRNPGSGSIWGASSAELYSTAIAAKGYVDSTNWNPAGDTVMVLYRGLNTGTTTPYAPPTTCPLTGATWVGSSDSDLVADYNPVVGTQNYTAVFTNYYSGAQTTKYTYSLFLYSGTQLGGTGPVIVTTGSGSGSSSDVSALAASALLVLAALVF
jgi:hypothetical protein